MWQVATFNFIVISGIQTTRRLFLSDFITILNSIIIDKSTLKFYNYFSLSSIKI